MSVSALQPAIASVPAGTAFFLIAGMTERLRVSLLAIPEAPAPFAGPWLFYGTVATMWFGIVGMLDPCDQY